MKFNCIVPLIYEFGKPCNEPNEDAKPITNWIGYRMAIGSRNLLFQRCYNSPNFRDRLQFIKTKKARIKMRAFSQGFKSK